MKPSLFLQGLLSFFITFSLFSCGGSQSKVLEKKQDPFDGKSIVHIEEFKSIVKKSELRILDAREEKEYKKGHIPGAISLHFKKTMGQGLGKRDIAPIKVINTLFSKAGLKHDLPVLVYGDGKDYRPESRLLWVLELHGVKHVAVLNGGLALWKSKGNGVSTEDKVPEETNYVSLMNSEIYADNQSVVRAMYNDGVAIVDVRNKAQYRGDSKKPYIKRAGHIPTAMNLDSKSFIKEGETFCTIKDFEEVKNSFDEYRNKETIIYCNSGRSASLVYLLMNASGAKAKVYDGSWNDWSNTTTLPVALGDLPGNP